MSSFETEIKCADRDAALAMALQYEQEWYWHQSTISETDRGIVLSYREQLDNQLCQTLFSFKK